LARTTAKTYKGCNIRNSFLPSTNNYDYINASAPPFNDRPFLGCDWARIDDDANDGKVKNCTFVLSIHTLSSSMSISDGDLIFRDLYHGGKSASVASEDFEILCETLKMTGLDDFSTGSGPWTVFVQADGAFHTLFGDHEELSMDVLTNLLAYHTVFDSEIYFDELIVNAFLLMYNGDKTLVLVHQLNVLENV
jgi:hypothetical protein